MSYLVFCVIDLKNARREDYHYAYMDLAELGLRRTLKSENGPSFGLPAPAVMGFRDGGSADEEDGYDEKWDEAIAVVAETRQASGSMLQRRLGVGYNRAMKMIERMEKEGIVGPYKGSKAREVLMKLEEYEKRQGGPQGDA